MGTEVLFKAVHPEGNDVTITENEYGYTILLEYKDNKPRIFDMSRQQMLHMYSGWYSHLGRDLRDGYETALNSFINEQFTDAEWTLVVLENL